jgi:ribosomal protein S19E (S16A)
MAGSVDWREVRSLFLALELDGMAEETRDGLYIITQTGRRYLDATAGRRSHDEDSV